MSNSNSAVLVDNYFVKHPMLFNIENVADESVSRTIFIEKNTSTLSVSSDSKFVAAQLNGEKYENMLTDVYTKKGIKLLEGKDENRDFELQSRGAVLTELLACDGLNPNKTRKLRLRAGTEFNAEKCLEETAHIQARVWKGNKMGLRGSMTRGLLRYLHHAIPLGLNMQRFSAILFENGPEDIMQKARTYISDGHARHTSYAQAINIIYNNYTTEDGKYKTINKNHSSYVKHNFLPYRPDGRRKDD